MNSNYNTRTPAERLIGRKLSGDWIVEEAVPRPEFGSGGNFSVSYIVRSKAGHKAFLKAIDFQRALESSDPALTLKAMTDAYIFERNLLEKCKTKRLSRIVRVLDSGILPTANGNSSGVVQYLIFELAEGDIRSYKYFNEILDTALALRALHQVAVALQQLHSVDIVHQDLKPSNVLYYDDTNFKLADLGRAYCREVESPHDNDPIAGDYSYAPPELLYNQVSPEWIVRRLGCDMYLLGSLVVFFVTGCSITHLLFARLESRFHYQEWGSSYSEVLPYLNHVFAQIISDLQKYIRTDYANEIADIVKQLCHPNPKQRGHPKNVVSSANQYSLERYISILNMLAKRAELSLTYRRQLGSESHDWI